MSQINENYIAHKNELGLSDERIASIQRCARMINRRVKYEGFRDAYDRTFTQVLMNGNVQIKYLCVHGRDLNSFSKFFLANLPYANIRVNNLKGTRRGIPSLIVDITSYVNMM